jgi:hypothetical protein
VRSTDPDALNDRKQYIEPIDRFGNRYPIDPFSTKLTEITEGDIQAQGALLQEALAALDRLSDGAWLWGNDELNMIALLICRGRFSLPNRSSADRVASTCN